MIALVIRLSWLNFHDAMSVLVFDSVCEFIVKDKQIMFILPDADQVTCHLFNAVSFMPKGYWCGIDVDWCHYRRCYRNQTQMEPEAKKQLLVPSLPHPLLYTLHFYPSFLHLPTYPLHFFHFGFFFPDRQLPHTQCCNLHHLSSLTVETLPSLLLASWPLWCL